MRLALGTAQFGLDYGVANRSGKIAAAEARSILEFASQSGINMLDTAIAYGDSEQRLGEIGVADWKIVSKLPPLPLNCDDIPGWVESRLAESLQRLNIAKLYGLLLHKPLELLEPRGIKLYRSLKNLRRVGLVRKIGVSVYDPAELDMLADRYRFDLVQLPLNLIDRRMADSGWLSRLHQNGVEIHSRSAFLQGLLLMQTGDRPAIFDRWSKLWGNLEEWLGETRLTPLAACLSFPLSFAETSKVIVGVDSLTHLREVVAAAKVSVSDFPDNLVSQDPDLLNPLHWIGHA